MSSKAVVVRGTTLPPRKTRIVTVSPGLILSSAAPARTPAVGAHAPRVPAWPRRRLQPRPADARDRRIGRARQRAVQTWPAILAVCVSATQARRLWLENRGDPGVQHVHRRQHSDQGEAHGGNDSETHQHRQTVKREAQQSVNLSSDAPYVVEQPSEATSRRTRIRRRAPAHAQPRGCPTGGVQGCGDVGEGGVGELAMRQGFEPCDRAFPRG